MVTPLPGGLAALYPFAPQSFPTPGGAKLSYVDEGPRGDEVVLAVHGNPTWSFFYRDLIRELSGSVRCLAPDHVGMGLSDKPAAYDYSLAGRVADLEALLASLRVKRVHLCTIGAGRSAWVGRCGIRNWSARLSSSTRRPGRRRGFPSGSRSAGLREWESFSCGA